METIVTVTGKCFGLTILYCHTAYDTEVEERAEKMRADGQCGMFVRTQRKASRGSLHMISIEGEKMIVRGALQTFRVSWFPYSICVVKKGW